MSAPTTVSPIFTRPEGRPPAPSATTAIARNSGPVPIEGLTTPEIYKQTVRDVQLLLDGKPQELEARLTERMMDAAMSEQFELAARLRDQLVTLSQMQDKQRIATADNLRSLTTLADVCAKLYEERFNITPLDTSTWQIP